MTDWFTPQQANLLGAVAGGVIGVLGGGVTGPVIGYFAPRGRAKGLVLGLLGFWLGLGVLLLVAGAAAAITGQPRHVVYPLALIGGIATVVMGGLLPVTIARYRQAERRRLEAEQLRRG